MPDEENIKNAIVELLYREANLLDERRFEEWLDLFTDDAKYRIPTVKVKELAAAEDEYAKDEELNFFEEDKKTLALRVNRLYTEFAWAENPPSKTVRIISNILIERSKTNNNEYIAKSNVIIYRCKGGDKLDIIPCRRLDIIRLVDNRLKIANRTVYLLTPTLNISNLSIFV